MVNGNLTDGKWQMAKGKWQMGWSSVKLRGRRAKRVSKSELKGSHADMRRTAFVLALLVTTMIGIRLQASDAMKAIVGSYLEIQNQLATDKIDGIKGPAKSIGAQATRMGDAGRNMAKAAAAIEKAADLKAAREAFGPLSEAVIAAAKAEGWKDVSDVKVAYCPMVKHSWLQKEDQIRNPYYGASMSTCGEFQKK
jgi:hypothetical protein